MEIDYIAYIRDFIDSHLEGNIDSLVDYDLKNLAKDEVYGCPGRQFDADDCNLMRVVYCLVFRETWANLTIDNCGNEKMRGDTMNSSGTFFSYPWDDRFTPKWNPPSDLSEKIKAFQSSFHTIGNMTVLPDKRIDDWSINKHRGCHDEWHDYEDRFLAALYKVLMQMPDADKDLQELVELNREDFQPFYGEEGWKRFIDGNLLEYYVDGKYIPVVTSKGYTWWRGGYTNKERFFQEANRYIDRSTEIIKNRGEQIVEKLKVHLYGAADLDKSRIRSMISRCEWTFAKTMPWCRHEYIVRGKCPLTEEEFLYFIDMQRRFGIKEHWGKYYNPYLYLDNYKYWTMGTPVENTIVMNRARVDK